MKLKRGGKRHDEKRSNEEEIREARGKIHGLLAEESAVARK